MGAISRKFRIPIRAESQPEDLEAAGALSLSHEQDAAIEIEIHEPALTEDNLGLKTWASSYVLAKKWHHLREHLLLPVQSSSARSVESLTILELGAGTGLVGLSAAAVLGVNVLLTDLPEIVSNLAHNADENADLLLSRGGSTTVAVVDWTKPQEVVYQETSNFSRDTKGPSHRLVDGHALLPGRRGLSVPVVVAADPIYSKDHPKLLAQAVDCHLERSLNARLIVEMPIRDTYAAERADYVSCMQDLGLTLIREEKDIGYDDWSEGRGEELAEVECWMTMWAWKSV